MAPVLEHGLALSICKQVCPDVRCRRRARRPREAATCFVSTLGDIMRGNTPQNQEQRPPPDTVPGWLSFVDKLPLSFPPPPPDTSTVKTRLRQARAATTRAALAQCKGARPMVLPPSKCNVSDAGVVQLPMAVAMGDAWSNALPFSSPPAEPCPGREAGAGGEDAAGTPNAEEVHAVLPWLYAAPGRLDLAAVEHISSQLALSQLQQLDVTRHLAAAGGLRRGLSDDICWVGATPLPSPTVAAAAALHRMAHRRGGGAAAELPLAEGSAVALCFHPHHREAAAEVVALYLHMYCTLDARDAAAAAGAALRCPPPPQPALEARAEELAAVAMGWLQRVVLNWRYGGGRVEAAGDAVGGWNRQVPLAFNVRHRAWRVQLWGLPPGTYAYKYLVDGQWCVDMAAPTQVDAWGNHNNVVLLPGCAVAGSPVEEAADAADGMAAAPFAAAAAAGQEAAAQSVALMPFEQGQDASQPARRQVEPPVTAEERLSMARFGAAVLALYTKSATRRRATIRRA